MAPLPAGARAPPRSSSFPCAAAGTSRCERRRQNTERRKRGRGRVADSASKSLVFGLDGF